MPQVTFSDRWLQSLKASSSTEYSDSVCPNLRLRVGRRSKTFSVMIGPAGSRRRVMLGKYPGLSLAEARRKAAGTSDDISQATYFNWRKKYAGLMPAFRQISATRTPSSPCFTMNAFCASENFDAFMPFHSSRPGIISGKIYLKSVQIPGGASAGYRISYSA